MTALDEDVDVDVSLDDDVPCEGHQCSEPAAWRVTAVHDTDQKCCAQMVLCDKHVQQAVEYERGWRQLGQRVICTHKCNTSSHLEVREL